MTLFVQPKYPRLKTNKNPIAKGATICKPFQIMLILMFTIYGINMSCRAQTNTDSLWTVWQDSSQHDTLRLDAIYNYAWDGYLFANPDSAFYFAQLQYNYAENKGHKKWMANALYTQGVAHYLNGKYTEALECYNQSLTIREEITDLKGIAVTLNGLGLIKEERGYHAEAIAHYMRSLKILEELGDKSRMAGIMNNIGIIYLTQGDDQQALVFYNRSLKIHEELNDKESTANALNNIGIIHKNNEDYELALEYYNRSLQLGEESGDQRGLSNSLINIGNVYVLQGDFSQALDYFNRSFKIKEEVGDKKGMAMSLIGLAEVYNEQKNYTKAIATAQKALSISQELGLAEVLREAANTLYQSYKANGNNRLSLEMYELYIATRDSLVSEENQREVIRYQYKSDYEKQYLTDSLNFARNEAIKNLELKKSENLKGFFIVASVLTFLLALFAYYGYRQKQKANIMLEERNKFEIENKKRAISLFGQQVSKEVALELLSDSYKSGSKKLYACIMFLDIRDFTPFTENKEPSEIILYQNNVFGFMIDIISKHHGIINQFLGDGFMATFGAPASSGNDSQNAVNASMEIVALLKKKCETGEIPLTKVGIGLHSGQIVSGNVGTSERKQYCITGNTVILASRIEQLNKKFKSEILISGEVQQNIDQTNLNMENLGAYNVKGRATPLEIVRLI